MIRRAVLLLLALTLPSAAHAGAMQSTASLQRQAESWLRARLQQPGVRVEVRAGPLDGRLRLPACPRPLQASMPARDRIGARVGVQLRCPVADGWRIRVPVDVQLYRDVLVTTRPLQRGDGIGAGDVRREELDVARLGYGYVERLDQLRDRTLAHPLGAGRVLAPGDLAGRRAVAAGDHVQLIADLGGVEARAGGVALGGGDVGARLRVRNDSSGRLVTGVVRGTGLVEALP
ncbi:flagellar basal body P-ring formation chaperone FlgA [Fulvimonas sp. R45]|uniref:flagellar basal body P-ring formation chaperone FlgA n=1 Tax=Fulvimonas sp. R45 TaxID=3045937 RepID=UPI00265F836E|nr:flagellar basal body P-ring formation chaperone FlgA [Fulvimonas sp. R45]MDO1528332.1 flagellar basal body P-ring formation chaperone FlgA [Fulvimonas sp. R45]